MISNLNSSNSNQTKPFGGRITNLSTSSSDSSCSSSNSSLATNNSGGGNSELLTSSSAGFDNGFSIYNKNIDFYESFRSYENAAKEMSSVKQGQLKNNSDSNSLVVVSNNNNNNNNISKIINNNINGNNNLNSNTSSSNIICSSNNITINNIDNNNTIINNNQKFKTTTALVNDLNDLHNYSKSPNAIDEVKLSSPATSSSSASAATLLAMNQIKQEDDDDSDIDDIDEKYHVGKYEDLPEIRGDDGDDKTPDHHARRPMNAFLIFCKRHRSIVRDRHPNLENRSITKILGDWWANLGKEDKNCYTELAKMYKDAFFTANPNFKWYKLPAPPLRTLSTRPCNLSPSQDYIFDFTSTHYEPEPLGRPERQRHDSYSSSNCGSSSSVNGGGGKNAKRRKLSTGVGQFKLADETQMGGLSSLLNASDSAVQNDDGTNKDQSLQDALSETSIFIAETMSSSRTEPFVNMRNHFGNNSKKNNCTTTTYNFVSPSSSHEEISDAELSKKWRIYDMDHLPPLKPPPDSPIYDDEAQFFINKKSSRSCKGKRYQEIMKSISKNGSPNKRVKVKNINNNLPALNENGFKHFDVGTVGMEIDVKDVSLEDQKDIDKKMFDASDFDLEEKIRALPALSLDDYLARKRETKKTKKKLGGRKNKSVKHEKQIGKIIHEINVSGSQKRKAPKESITRRTEVLDDDSTGAQDILNNIPTIATVPGQQGTADLFTLAEVALQKASIDKPNCKN